MKNRIILLTLFILFTFNLVNVFAQNEPPIATQDVSYLDILDERIKKNPKDTEALFLRSEVYISVGDAESAIVDLTKLISIDPKSAIYYLRRSAVYFDKKDYIKAKADALKSLEIDSSSASAAGAYYIKGSINLINTLNTGKKTEPLLPDFDKAIELNSELSDFYVNRGIAHFLEGKSQKALLDFDKATELGSEKTDLISFFRERATIAKSGDEKSDGLAGQYFFMMENLRQKNLQTLAAVRFSDQTIAPVKSAKTVAARKKAAQKSYLAHIKSEKFILASLAEVTKIRRLPFSKAEWERLRKAEADSKLPTVTKIQSLLNTSLAIVRRNISILKMLR